MTPKHLLSTVGSMNIGRRYYACRHCGQTHAPWDAWAGLGTRQMTEHARRIVVTVSTAWSFDRASSKLKDICAMTVSDDTIERVCQEEGEQARKWLREAACPPEEFAKAAGDVEFYSDGLKINTRKGWREMRLNLLQKRQKAQSVEAQKWNDRVLPEASVRLASCAIADGRLVGAMWKQWSKRLGLEQTRDLSVIGDGAPWIWTQAARRLSPQAQWCVDVYHVSEHIHDCGKALLGEGASARSWAKQRLEELISVGGPRFIQSLDQLIARGLDEKHRQAMTSLRTFLWGNRDRMWYAQRLAEGRAIGSGAVEGACKKIGQRLKLNSARWRVRRAERFGALLCMEYTAQTAAYWQSHRN